MASVDPISLSQALIRCPSVTPEDGGAIGIVANCVMKIGLAVVLGTPQFRRVTATILGGMAAAIIVSVGMMR